MKPIVSYPCPPSAQLVCPIGFTALSHTLTLAALQVTHAKTIFDDARRLPNIAKEITKEITKERMKLMIADPCPPTA